VGGRVNPTTEGGKVRSFQRVSDKVKMGTVSQKPGVPKWFYQHVPGGEKSYATENLVRGEKEGQCITKT